jgi:xanthine/uracil permease
MSRPNKDFYFEYSGLEGIWKSIALWGAVGVVCWLLNPLPARLVLIPLLLGLAAGLLSAWWIYLAKTSRIEPTRWLALLSLLSYTLTQEKENVESAIGFLAMGSFLSASINVSRAFFIPIALNRLQERMFGST